MFEVEYTDEFGDWWKTGPLDPRRVAILLIGGNKRGDDRWYRTFVPRADDLYDKHLATLRLEGLI